MSTWPTQCKHWRPRDNIDVYSWGLCDHDNATDLLANSSRISSRDEYRHRLLLLQLSFRDTFVRVIRVLMSSPTKSWLRHVSNCECMYLSTIRVFILLNWLLIFKFAYYYLKKKRFLFTVQVNDQVSWKPLRSFWV